MLVTIDWMQRNYSKFNKRYFGGMLPNIEFAISRSKRTWGFAEYTYVYLMGERTIKPSKITMSNYYDSPEKVKQTTLLHEMIHIADYTFHPEHYSKDWKKLSGHRYDAHGVWFRDEADRLSKYGWKIEKYVTAEEHNVSVRAKKVNPKVENKRKQNKIDNALICCVIGTNGAWWFKTDKNKIYSILDTIKDINWYTIGKAEKVKFYKFDNKYLANRRSCNKKLSGWKVTNSKLSNILNKYNATEYTEFKFAA